MLHKCIFCEEIGTEEQLNEFAGKFVCDDCLDVIMAIIEKRIDERDELEAER